MMEVRSDFSVSLKIKGANGHVRSMATHRSEVVEMEGQSELNPVPHLHRLAPDGHWLASLDADDRRVYLTPVGEGSQGGPRSFSVDGIEGDVRQFRWLESDEVLAVATKNDVFLVPIPDSLVSEVDMGELEITSGASSVFADVDKSDGDIEVLDLRVAPGGFFARVGGGHASHWFRQQVFYARISDATVQELDAIVPDGLTARGATLGFGDELVVPIGHWEDDYFTEESDPLRSEHGELWRYALSAYGEPEHVGRLACADEFCEITNWAPGSSPLVAVDGYREVVVFNKDAPDDVSSLEFKVDLGSIDSLWAWPEGGWVASDNETVSSFDDQGTRLWSWTAPGDRAIHGVHLSHGAQSVLVTAGLNIYEVKAGKARRVVRSIGAHRESRREHNVWEGISESFIDQAIALPGGGIAYTVVDLERSYEEATWDEHEWEEGLELSEPESDLLAR